MSKVFSGGFGKKSSSLDRASKTLHSVPLNSWDSFFVTLSSISTDIWVMESSWFPRDFVFQAWLFLERAPWSFRLLAAIFHLFLRNAIFEKKSAVFGEGINFYEDFGKSARVYLSGIQLLYSGISTIKSSFSYFYFCYLNLLLGAKRNCLQAKPRSTKRNKKFVIKLQG